MLDLAEQRASAADIVGASMLGKRTSVRSHTPHPHVQIDWYALFRPGKDHSFNSVPFTEFLLQMIKGRPRG
jgi:hypothetical protein